MSWSSTIGVWKAILISLRYVWHDSFSRVTSAWSGWHTLQHTAILISLRSLTYVWHDSFSRVTWPSTWVTWLCYTCDMTPANVGHDSLYLRSVTRVWYEFCNWVTCDMRFVIEWHDSVVRVLWLFQKQSFPMSLRCVRHVWHDALEVCVTCVTWLWGMCDMRHDMRHVWHDMRHVWHDAFRWVTWIVELIDLHVKL